MESTNLYHPGVVGSFDVRTELVDPTAHLDLPIGWDVSHHPEYLCEIALFSKNTGPSGVECFWGLCGGKPLAVVGLNRLQPGFNILDNFLRGGHATRIHRKVSFLLRIE
jgi:hypothetical protein